MHRNCSLQRGGRRAAALLTALLGLCVASGCGDVKIAPVHGRVFVNGEPAGPGLIIFQPIPDDGERLPAAMGEINEQGEYTLTTRSPGDGAVVGRHEVLIQGGDAFDEAPAATAASHAIPLRYADPQTGGLTAEVPAKGAELDFQLTAP